MTSYYNIFYSVHINFNYGIVTANPYTITAKVTNMVKSSGSILLLELRFIHICLQLYEEKSDYYFSIGIRGTSSYTRECE